MILSYCFPNFQTFCIISLILSKNPDSIYVISYHARGFLSGFFVFFCSIITYYDQSVKKRSQLNGWQLAQNRLGFVQVIYCFHFLYCETESAKCSSISVIFLLSSKQIFCRFSEFSACADTSSVVADRLDIWSTIFALLSCKFTQSL